MPDFCAGLLLLNTNWGLIPGEDYFPLSRCFLVAFVLCLGLGSCEISLLHIGMTIGVCLIRVLFFWC